MTADSVENHLLHKLGPRVLCRSTVGRRDLDGVAELAELFGQVLSAIDKEPWFGFGTLLDVAYSLMKNLPDQAA
jgi:hypothetical protein